MKWLSSIEKMDAQFIEKYNKVAILTTNVLLYKAIANRLYEELSSLEQYLVHGFGFTTEKSS